MIIEVAQERCLVRAAWKPGRREEWWYQMNTLLKVTPTGCYQWVIEQLAGIRASESALGSVRDVQGARGSLHADGSTYVAPVSCCAAGFEP